MAAPSSWNSCPHIHVAGSLASFCVTPALSALKIALRPPPAVPLIPPALLCWFLPRGTYHSMPLGLLSISLIFVLIWPSFLFYPSMLFQLLYIYF